MIDQACFNAIRELLTESLRAGNAIRIRANGTSMIPAIWPGDVLTVVPATPSTPTLGDVALMAMHGRLVAHRVIERGALGGAVALVTCGDALEREDPLTTGDAILGTVVARNGRGIRAAQAGRTSLSVNLARLLVRSAPLLAIALKVRAFVGRLVRAAV